MRRGRPPSSPSPFRALAHHHQHQQANSSAMSDPSLLIRSFDVENNPARPVRPSPLAASTIRDMPLDLVERIRSFPLFQSAPDDFLVAVGNHLKPQVHGPNDHVVTEGDDAKAMYWLVRGVVAVTSRDGEAVYAELKSGAFFGEIGVLMDMPRTATIIARTKCLVLVLKKEDLQLVMPSFPDMEKALTEEAQERLNLLRKQKKDKRRSQERPSAGGSLNGATDSSSLSSRTAAAASAISAAVSANGDVASGGEQGAIRHGAAIVNAKKRKSPSPDMVEDPASGGSVIGSGLVNVRNTLKELPLFSKLPPEILHFLGLSVEPKTYPPFTEIVRQGSRGSEIYFIVKGEAEVVRQESRSSIRQQQRHAPLHVAASIVLSPPRLKPGQYFGEVASLGLSPGRTATVRSITAVECLVVPGHVLAELWRRCPSDIRSQVEQTAKTRYEGPLDEQAHDDDSVMVNADADASDQQTKRLYSGPQPPTPTTPDKPCLPELMYKTPPLSKPDFAASRDDSEMMEPTDPDPFLSLDMENLRNRRRQSLAPVPPPTLADAPATVSTTPGGRKRISRPLSVDFTTSNPSLFTPPYANASDLRAKRAKTLPSQPRRISQAGASLPDQVLVRVFEAFDIGQLMKLRAVCRRWRALLATSPQVCHDVDLSRYNRSVNDQVLADFIGPFVGSRAVSVDLTNCFHVTDQGFAALLRHCGTSVRHWRMRSVWDVSAHKILEMSENAKDLEEVDWSNCRKVGDYLLTRVVGWVVPSSPAVTTKSAPASSASPVGHAKGSAKQQKHAKQQQHQQQQASSTRANSAPLAPGTVVGCSRLNKLNLSYCKHITDRSMAHLAAHASNRIRSLCLTRCTSITDVGFQMWAQHRFDKLTHLSLSDCTYLTDKAITALAGAAKNLTHLDLTFCCALTDTSIEVVAVGLHKMRELKMAFCGSAVSDQSLEMVALHLQDLEGISVRGCVRVTSLGVENVLARCSRLQWVDISQCRNVECWIRDGGVSRWGYNACSPKPTAMPPVNNSLLAGFDIREKPTTAQAMSVAMLTSPGFFGSWGRQPRNPVRFITVKGPDDELE
ncbi:hypothetical protein CDD82_1457 [Ophiocordyceps australis]|uniref:Cyclic nucleotide-binding domain-containing protein n=1 Tax=Ophiocordyceps australis TaxID=1399860 RepID=A0A2C5ZIM3_9HYPO|nr:hypothetical protein CDD82_1457 [Ophiocordyceps australis]